MEVFKENEWVILGLPHEGERLIQLKISEQVELGRFGRFGAEQLVGKRPSGYYWIESDGTLVATTPWAVQQSGVEATDAPGVVNVAEIKETNQMLQDTNTSQRLSTTDIETLKAQVESGQMASRDIISTVVANSETFGSKNAFSQMKYVQRKQRKHLRWCTARKVTVRTLSSYFMKRDPRKIMDLRLDVLSQIICLGNVQSEGCRVLIWDETVGFLTGALLSKTPSSALLVNVHPDRQMQVSGLMYYNLDEGTRARLHPLPLDSLASLLDPSTEADVFVETGETDPERLAIQHYRFEQRQARKQLMQSLLSSAAFDALVIATQRTDPLPILTSLAPLLRPSAKLVIYSTWREMLLPTFVEVRQAVEWVDVELHESFLRPYQAAPGRMHPVMNCNGHAGTILSATKAIPMPK